MGRMQTMRMQKEEKIVVVLLLMALGSLATAFWAFGPGDCDSNGSSATDKTASTYVEGHVVEMKPTKSGGNLILGLDSTPLTIFIPAKSGASIIQKTIRLGDRVSVKGILSEFNSQEELEIASINDIAVLK